MINSGRMMTWCSHCGKNCDTYFDYTTNTASCVECGKVLFEDAAAGAHQPSTSVRIESAYFELQRRTLGKGNLATSELIYKNRITKVLHATRHYKGREMIWCPHCVRKGMTSHDDATGSIHCVDCGKILSEDMHTEKVTFSRDAPRGKDKRKLALDAERLKPSQTYAEAVSQSSRKKRLNSKINYEEGPNTLFDDKQIPKNCSHAVGKELAKEDSVDAYIHERGYDNQHESCDYSYDYDYDGGDEYDDCLR